MVGNAFMKIVATSDTHSTHHKIDVPNGDIFIHAGDLTHTGTMGELEEARDWIYGLPHPHKVIISGNHDFAFQKNNQARMLFWNCHYLQDSGCEIEGLKIYGSPWQPWFYSWAFNLPRGPVIDAYWQKIPENLDILITHGPPKWKGDLCPNGNVGCADLLTRVYQKKPKYHIFGHIHEGYGTYKDASPTTFMNVSSAYGANPCVTFDIEPNK
jgi:Icc-related predicted phosphoesterase